jgi:hypothetical protein
MHKTQFARVLLVAAFVTPSMYAKYTKRDATPLPTVSVLGPTNSLIHNSSPRPAKQPKANTTTATPQIRLQNGWTLHLTQQQ